MKMIMSAPRRGGVTHYFFAYLLQSGNSRICIARQTLNLQQEINKFLELSRIHIYTTDLSVRVSQVSDGNWLTIALPSCPLPVSSSYVSYSHPPEDDKDTDKLSDSADEDRHRDVVRSDTHFHHLTCRQNMLDDQNEYDEIE